MNSQDTNASLHPECPDWRRLADNPLEAMLRAEAAAVEVENEQERSRFLELARDEEAQQECQAVTRRRVLVGAGLAATALTTAQWVSTRASFAATSTGTLIQVFCYGGTDGLSVMASNDDMGFLQSARGGFTLGNTALAIDRNFRLSTALQPLESMIRSNNAAFIPGVSDARLNRSHFAATDIAQLGGMPADVNGSGWLDNLLGVLGPGTAFRGVSVGNTLTRSLVGQHASLALRNVGSLNIESPDGYRDRTISAIQTLFGMTDHPVELSVKAGIDALNLASSLAKERNYQGANGAQYARNGVADSFKTLAQLIKGGAKIRAATVSQGGYDTHENQGLANGDPARPNENGYLWRRLNELAGAIAAFFTDLGIGTNQPGQEVTVIVNTEFGRRVRNNGTGTDHGHGGVLWIVSGKKLAGNVLGNWGGLSEAKLVNGDVPEYNNMFQVFGSVAQGRFGLTNAEVQKIFPRMKYAPMKLFA